jgi:hypothetical protein
MAQPPVSSEFRRQAFWRWTQAGALVVLILCACLYVGHVLARRVADLTPAQIRERMAAEQTPPVETMVEQVNRLNALERREVMTSAEATRYFQRLRPDERLRFVRQTLDRGIQEQIERYRNMNKDERSAFVEETKERQRQARERMDKMTPQEKEEMRAALQESNMQEVIERAVKEYLSVSTSEERAELAPLYNGALENLNHARNLR